MGHSVRQPRRLTFPVPLTIGVIADTHIYARGRRRLPAALPDLFRRFGVGLVLHAGDVNAIHVLEDLSGIAPLLVVAGNNDGDDVLAIAPQELSFVVGGHRFVLVHGHGGASARAEARRRAGPGIACVVYGHSHIPMIEKVDDTILFNPGSATDRRWQEHFGVGLLYVIEKKVEPELVLYSDARDLGRVDPD